MKALALDMDGTILDHSGQFSLNLVDTLAELKKRGMHIFFATGRTSHEIISITPEHCPLDGYVAASGMGIYVGGELVDAAAFKPDFVDQMIEAAREREVYYEVHTLENSSRTLLQDQEYSFADISRDQPETMKDFEYRFAQDTMNSETQWVEELPFDHVVKLFFFSTDLEKIKDWYYYLKDRQDESDYALYTTSIHNAEVMLKGRDKATGTATLLEHFNISFQDVHVIGDSMNDLPLFEKAGHRTAMKNATDAVKAAADDITEFTCDEDGLKRYLEETYLK